MGDTLNIDQELIFDQELVANSGNCRVVFQGDGNLVLYRLVGPDDGGNWQPIWDTKTYGKHAKRCVMQGDGNLVIYDGNDEPKWASNTFNSAASFAVIQDDENFVLYRPDGSPVWASNTWNPNPYLVPPCAQMKTSLGHERQHLQSLMAHPDPTNPAWKAAVSGTNRRIRGWESLISIKC